MLGFAIIEKILFVPNSIFFYPYRKFLIKRAKHSKLFQTLSSVLLELRIKTTHLIMKSMANGEFSKMSPSFFAKKELTWTITDF